MRLLILGGNGRLGHRLWLAARDVHETWITMRGPLAGHPWSGLFEDDRTVEHVRAEDASSLERAMQTARPDVVINALGLVKQRPEGTDPGAAFLANCFVPHHLRRLCDAGGARLLQVSTDCVFSGERGGYGEDDVPDATDVYGLSKRLGEVGAPHLTIRTSLIGRDLTGAEGLLEWLLSRRGTTVSGYANAFFSGLVTEVLADTLLDIAVTHPSLAGLRHLASDRIDKHQLLVRLTDALDLDVQIRQVDEPRIDRSLDDRRIRQETGIPRLTWDAMLERLAADPTPYDRLRG